MGAIYHGREIAAQSVVSRPRASTRRGLMRARAWMASARTARRVRARARGRSGAFA